MDYELIRQTLAAQLGALRNRADRIEKHLRNEDRELPNDSTDRADLTENDEVLELLDTRIRDEIIHVRDAIRRIDAGTFGRCVECGEPIDEKRLKALPATPTCLVCAATVVGEHA